ncbi:MAG: VOC family protein [Cryobacterium sp.]
MADEDVPTEYTPATFHEQSGVSDWRVTSWGPQAVYTASSLQEASRLVSEAAAGLGLVAAPELIQTVDIMVVQSGVDTRPFWTAALGYDVLGDTDAVDPLRRGPSLSFTEIDRSGRGRTHIDVSVPTDRARERVDAALSAGGRLVDDTRAPMWWTIASPGNHGIDIAAWTDTWGG